MLGLAEEQPELCAAFDGSAHGPAPVDAAEKAAPAGVAPQWLVDRLSHLPVPDRTLAAGRAALDLRVNRLKADQDAVLAAFPGSAPTAHAPDGVRLAEAVAIDAHPLFLDRSEEHTYELQSLMRISYAVFCLKNKRHTKQN